MKKIKKILMILALILVSYGMPTVQAKEKVNIYLFYGEGCPHCEALMEYLDGLDDETKAKFKLVKNEVWSNEENSNLMERVAEKIGDDEVSGVPYFVIGKKSFSGYSESLNEDILAAIDKASKSNYDVMDNLNTKASNSSNNTLVYISIAIIVIGIAGLLVYTKKSVN